MSSEMGVALVTGGTSGIGLAIARGLAERGYEVIVTGRTPPAVGEGEAAGALEHLAVDHADPGSVAHVRDHLERRGPLAALVNNVGRRHGARLGELEWESLRETFELNAISAIMLTQGLLPEFGADGGAIVNVSSRLARVGMAGVSGYAASKGAVNGFTVAAAVELAPKRIRVNAIAPGMTKTPLIKEWLEEQPNAQAAEAQVSARIPLGTLATPADIAGAAVFLASPESRYITGVVLPVDGGYTAS